MKLLTDPDLGRLIIEFFESYLPDQRGASLHTLRSYRNAVVLWLQFAAHDSGRRIESLEIADFTTERVERFLAYLEAERGNGIATRNVCLAALHTFARHLETKHPEQLGRVQSIPKIPVKRGAHQAPIEYPESADIRKFMRHIDCHTRFGQRDFALFTLMLNTGARVQEVLNLRVRDLRLDPPEQVRLLGKGGKIRLCPLWPRTVRLLRELIATQPPSPDQANSVVFRNRNGRPLTRFAVRYLLRCNCRITDRRQRVAESIRTPCAMQPQWTSSSQVSTSPRSASSSAMPASPRQ